MDEQVRALIENLSERISNAWKAMDRLERVIRRHEERLDQIQCRPRPSQPTVKEISK